MLDHAGFHKLPKGLQITVGDVYDFVSDVNAVVTVHFLNFVNSNDVGAMNTQETFFWQHVFYSLHRQMGDKRLVCSLSLSPIIFLRISFNDFDPSKSRWATKVATFGDLRHHSW